MDRSIKLDITQDSNIRITQLNTLKNSNNLDFGVHFVMKHFIFNTYKHTDYYFLNDSLGMCHPYLHDTSTVIHVKEEKLYMSLLTTILVL